jgi:hypothetical protein
MSLVAHGDSLKWNIQKFVGNIQASCIVSWTGLPNEHVPVMLATRFEVRSFTLSLKPVKGGYYHSQHQIWNTKRCQSTDMVQKCRNASFIQVEGYQILVWRRPESLWYSTFGWNGYRKHFSIISMTFPIKTRVTRCWHSATLSHNGAN